MIPDSSWAVPWDLLATKSRPFFLFPFLDLQKTAQLAICLRSTGRSLPGTASCLWFLGGVKNEAAMRWSQEMGKPKERYCDITKGRFTELCHLARTLSEICSKYKNVLYENIQEMLLSHNYLYLCPSHMRRTHHFSFCESGHWRGDCSFTLRLIPYARREHAWLAALHCTHRGNPKFQS